MSYYIIPKKRDRWWEDFYPRHILGSMKRAIADSKTPAWRKNNLFKGLGAVTNAERKGDQELLLQIALTAALEEVATAAAECIIDDELLMQILRDRPSQMKSQLSLAAVMQLQKQELLAEVALDRHSDQGAAAVARSKITDEDLLLQIAMRVITYEAVLAVLDIDDEHKLARVAQSAESPLAQLQALRKLDAMGHQDLVSRIARWSTDGVVRYEAYQMLEQPTPEIAVEVLIRMPSTYREVSERKYYPSDMEPMVPSYYECRSRMDELFHVVAEDSQLVVDRWRDIEDAIGQFLYVADVPEEYRHIVDLTPSWRQPFIGALDSMDEGGCDFDIDQIRDQEMLYQIYDARRLDDDDVHYQALVRIDDPAILARCAMKYVDDYGRSETYIMDRIDDQDVLADIALNSDADLARTLAVKRLDDSMLPLLLRLAGDADEEYYVRQAAQKRIDELTG